MNDSPHSKRATLAPRQLVASLLSRLRRALGSLFQLVFHDQIGDLRRQAQRLGSASVESATYLAGEVRALDQRLEAIERELAALRELLESERGSASAPAEDAAEVAGQPHAG